MSVEIQDLGATPPFAFSAPEAITSSHANQHSKETVQGLVPAHEANHSAGYPAEVS